MSDLLTGLDSRRSVPSRQLSEPGPDDAVLLRMLRSAVRVPDHGKRVPFRFLRIHGDARHSLGEALVVRALERDPAAGDGRAVAGDAADETGLGHARSGAPWVRDGVRGATRPGRAGNLPACLLGSGPVIVAQATGAGSRGRRGHGRQADGTATPPYRCST